MWKPCLLNPWPSHHSPPTCLPPHPRQIKSLAPTDVPVLALAPHVAASLANRSVTSDWVLPIYPFRSANPCSLQDLRDGRHCIRGFSVQARRPSLEEGREEGPSRGVLAAASASLGSG